MALKWFQEAKNKIARLFDEPVSGNTKDSNPVSAGALRRLDRLYAEQHPDDPKMPDDLRKSLAEKLNKDIPYAEKLYAEQHPDNPKMPESLRNSIVPGFLEYASKRRQRGE